jgi:hypothetical protein
MPHRNSLERAGEQVIKPHLCLCLPVLMPSFHPQKINLWVRNRSVWVKLNVLMGFEPARGGDGWGDDAGQLHRIVSI